MAIVVERNHAKCIGEAVNQGATQSWVHAPLAQLIGLRSFNWPRIDRQQHCGAITADLNVDGASVM